MLSKWKLIVIPALILMIMVSPYYVKAQTNYSAGKSLSAGADFVITATSTVPTFRLDIKDNNEDWSQFDIMTIDWKLENTNFPTSSIAYFEIIGDSPSSTDAVIYPVSNVTVAETKNPLDWELPDDITTGEYHLNAYIYTLSSEPVLTSNSVGFYVARQDISPNPVVIGKTGDNQSSSGQSTVSVQNTDNNYLVNKGRIDGLKKSINDLEKYLKELKDQLNQLGGSTASSSVEVIEVATSSSEMVLLNKIPVGWSDEYLTMTDSDKDQLPDTVELIIGSNPNVADSDNDGYADGVEVKNNYNPLLAEKTKVSLNESTSFEGKVINTSDSQGQKNSWLIKNNQKIYLNMPAT